MEQLRVFNLFTFENLLEYGLFGQQLSLKILLYLELIAYSFVPCLGLNVSHCLSSQSGGGLSHRITQFNSHSLSQLHWLSRSSPSTKRLETNSWVVLIVENLYKVTEVWSFLYIMYIWVVKFLLAFSKIIDVVTERFKFQVKSRPFTSRINLVKRFNFNHTIKLLLFSESAATKLLTTDNLRWRYSIKSGSDS